MKNLKDELEIMIPSYNRCEDLKRTLQELLDERSPVKNLSITVLDNHSDDGTQSLMQNVCKNYLNVKYIRHNRNIGIVANNCRSIELATKKYLWVIDDDSYYDWDRWEEVQKGIDENADFIMVAIPKYENERWPNDMRILPIIPGGNDATQECIYKIEKIHDGLFYHLYDYSSEEIAPLVIVACVLVNQGARKVCVVTKNVILNKTQEKVDFDWNRIKTQETTKCFIRKSCQPFAYGFFSCIQDKKLRDEIFSFLIYIRIVYYNFCFKKYENSLFFYLLYHLPWKWKLKVIGASPYYCVVFLWKMLLNPKYVLKFIKKS